MPPGRTSSEVPSGTPSPSSHGRGCRPHTATTHSHREETMSAARCAVQQLNTRTQAARTCLLYMKSLKLVPMFTTPSKAVDCKKAYKGLTTPNRIWNLRSTCHVMVAHCRRSQTNAASQGNTSQTNANVSKHTHTQQ
jgi:hypothetical protein